VSDQLKAIAFFSCVIVFVAHVESGKELSSALGSYAGVVRSFESGTKGPLILSILTTTFSSHAHTHTHTHTHTRIHMHVTHMHGRPHHFVLSKYITYI